METAVAHLLNFSAPFDCNLLDQIMTIAMDGANPQRPAANDFLMRIKEHPEMWRRTDAILESSKQIPVKYLALQIMTDAINTRWKVIPEDQREGVRSYIVGKIIALSSSDTLLKQNRDLLSRLNLTLVQILKQDWPHNWPSFIGDIVASSKTSESLCENNMKVLKLLSEEVFDYSKDSMTQQKMKTMKGSLNEEFSAIFQLCEFILQASSKQSLLLATLETLQRFLTWIPLGYIFETQLVTVLISKFLPIPAFRVATIECLTEIASLPPHEIPDTYKPAVQQLLVILMQSLTVIIPPDANLRQAFADGSDDECTFVSRLALFLCTYLKSFLPYFDVVPGDVSQGNSPLYHEQAVVQSLVYMLKISEVQDEEIFKVALEFWVHFTKDLYTADIQWKTSGTSLSSLTGGFNPMLSPGGSNNGNRPQKSALYENLLHALRIVMIDNMAKPEEVLIVEDDNGEIVREMTKDTEVIAQYKTMRETVVYLTNLNYEDTESIMLEKLDLQVTGGRFNWTGLNTLCWAIGSISGAMSELDEKRFLVSVIKDLLRLCEEQRGKDNKAVVASNIMYIVGQYPRFLRAHWKFLKTVVNKLFEFMHEHHPGVQDMACDTFLKIAVKCKRKFMTSQVEDPQPFILTLIADLNKHINDLLPHQVQSFYESVGTMLSDSGPAIRMPREEVVMRLMELQNNAWKARMNEGAQNVQALLQMDAIKDLSRILRINTRVCASAGSIYMHQLSAIFLEVLNVYRLYSEQIVQAVNTQGPIAVRLTNFKAMRSVKTEILELFIACLEVCHDTEGGDVMFKTNFMPNIMSEILTDYHTSPPCARDSKVLSLFSTAVCSLKDLLTPDIPRIMDALFQKTLEMITTNMLDYPEHRINFFKFLHDANTHCFYGLFSIPQQSQKLVIDSIVWAFKHTERNISETGLDLLYELLQNISTNPAIAQPFYATFMLSLIQDIFSILTDRLHKSGFKQQASILKHLFHITAQGQVTVPLHSMGAQLDNASFLKEHVSALLLKAFPNLSKAQSHGFVVGMFDISLNIDQFKAHLRDFLVTIKEFANEDNSELFLEEKELDIERSRAEQWTYRASVPGLLKPDELGEMDPEL